MCITLIRNRIPTLVFTFAGGSESDSSKPECDAPEWLGNIVAPGGYGDNTAFPPSRIEVAAEPFLSYVSNGTVPLPMNITVRDAADTIVTAGKLHLDASHIHMPNMVWTATSSMLSALPWRLNRCRLNKNCTCSLI